MNKLALSAVIFLAACGGGGGAEKGMVNTASATQSVEQVIAVGDALASSSGDQAASAVQSMTSAGQSIVTPQQQGRELPMGLLPSSFPKNLGGNATTGTADCTPSGCTFDNYGDDAAGWSIDGTITKSGDTTSFDLEYHVTSGGMPLDWTIDGSVTITATLIDGNVHSHGVTTLQGGSGVPGGDLEWDTKVDYESIVITDGCATGGSIHAVVDYKYAGQHQATEGTASFGPNCGDVTGE
jgi:hypothetical protein